MRFSRITVLKLFFLGFALAIVGRAVQLQVGSDTRLEQMARRQFSSKVTTLPRRGLIFDRNGEGLAISLKASSLFFRPESLKKETTAAERNRIFFNLAKIIHTPVDALASKARSEKGFVWIKRQLTEAEERSIKDRGLLDYGDGVGLAEETKRFYPNKDLAAHVLGSVNIDGQGLEGLELFYDSVLNGERTRVASNKDAMGRKIFRDSEGWLAFRDGRSLVLTLDKAVQYETEKALRAALDTHQAKAGTAIVAEVETGEILAMVNYPTFTPGDSKHANADSRRNRAITDTYEPGSTFKPFVAAYALERGRSPKTKIYCEKGSFKVGDRKISEATADEKYEWLTLGEILKFSSNIGAAKLALDMGPSNMGHLIEKLGMGKRTGIDLPGEVGGSVSIKELSNPVRLANVGFGHGLTVTPLQMLSYYLMLANGGAWVQPKLVKAVLAEDPDSLLQGNIRYRLGQRFDTPRPRKVFSAQTSRQITEMLETVVDEKGTGTQAQLEDWSVAGKTGTAQKVDPETHRYSRTRHISTFAGFAPAKDPKLVALVLLDEPQGKLYAGGYTAAPAFREIMRAALLRSRVMPENKSSQILQLANRSLIDHLEKHSEVKESGQPGPENSEKNISVNDRFQIQLPDLKGLSIREALRSVGNQSLDIEIIGSGILKEQIPPAGHWLEAGAKVKLLFHPEFHNEKNQ